MRTFKAERKDGKTEYYPAYTVEEFPLENVSRETLVLRRKKKEIVFSSAVSTFDIETTTINDGDVHEGFMYIWQYCIDGIVVYGRDWTEFTDLLNMIDNALEGVKIIYVHNLSFEFQFIRQLLKREYGDIEIFAPQPRKPLTVRVPGKFEFRCSYKLSNMSLYKATSNELGCVYIKADGDLDYRKFRTKETALNDTEFAYCMNDVLSLWSYILAKLKNDADTLISIPLTSTGYVRRDCRIACKASKRYMSTYKRQTMTKNIYLLLKDLARGGDTGANRFLAGEMIGNVDSYDVVSSYPYQLLTQKYPSTRFHKYGTPDSLEAFEELCQKYAVIFRIGFTNLRAKKTTIDLYLPKGKMLAYTGKVKNCNGRVLKASDCVYALTDIDWEIVKASYDWDEIAISDVYYAKYDYLPLELRKVILNYFRTKCELKDELETAEDIERMINEAYLYAKSKNKLNGIFGMAYTDPVRDEITVNDEGKWKKDTPDTQEALDIFYNNGNNFLVYAWGVYTTAHARKHLNKLINIIGEGTIYWDTDSDKGIVSEEAKKAIEEENEKIKKICEERGAYIDTERQRYYLGIYEHETAEGAYQTFKTLGAKKYAYVDHEGKLHCTISGVAKSKSPLHPDGARELGTIDNFKPGFIFHEAGGLTLYYNHQPWQKKVFGGVEHWTGDNIGTKDSTYEIGLTDEYAGIIGYNLYKTKEL